MKKEKDEKVMRASVEESDILSHYGDISFVSLDYTHYKVALAKIDFTLKVMLVAISLECLILFLSLFFVYNGDDSYYASSPSGMQSKLNAMPSPMVNTSTVSLWVSRAVSSTYTFDSVNFKQQLYAAGAKYFTKDTWESFKQKLIESDTIKTLRESGSLSVKTVVTSTPAIQDEGFDLIENAYVWTFSVQASVTYRSTTSKTFSRVFLVKVKVDESPDRDQGLAFVSFVPQS